MSKRNDDVFGNLSNDGRQQGHNILGRIRDFTTEHRVLAGAGAAALAYIPFAAATGYYPQRGPAPRSMSSNSRTAYPVVGEVSLRQFEGKIWASGSVQSIDTVSVCKSSNSTTLVNGKSVTTSSVNCTVKTQSVPMQIQNIVFSDARGDVLAEAGSTAGYLTLMEAGTPKIACPPRGEVLTAKMDFRSESLIGLLEGRQTVTTSFVSDGECAGHRGWRFSNYHGTEVDSGRAATTALEPGSQSKAQESSAPAHGLGM